MLSSVSRRNAFVAGAIALSLLAWNAPALAGADMPGESQSRYLPIQAITQEFGSKSVGGYFLSQSNKCLVTLMLMEKIDPDAPPPAETATRIRLVLEPGQIAGFDSDQGKSVNVTCGQDAASLTVDVGSREQLVSRQSLVVRKSVAEVQTR